MAATLKGPLCISVFGITNDPEHTPHIPMGHAYGYFFNDMMQPYMN